MQFRDDAKNKILSKTLLVHMWDCTISRWNYSVLLCSRATLENLEYKKFFKNVSRKRYKEVTFQKSGNSHFSTYFFFKWAVQNFTALNFRSFWRIFVNPELNCFCGMVDRRKAFSLISSRDHCQRSSPSRISDTPRAGFEDAQNLSSGLVEWSCAVVIITTPRRQKTLVPTHFI